MVDFKSVLQECVRLVLLVISFGSGIAVIAIISKLEGDYGNCIVLADVKWDPPAIEQWCQDSGFEHCFTITDKPGSCSYLIKYQGTACFVSVVFIVFFLVQLFKKKEYSWSLPVVAVVSLVYSLLALIAAIILIVGIRKLCNEMREPDFIPDESPCEAFRAWKGDGDGINFINRLKHAETASWISCCSWLILCIIQVIKIVIKSRSGNKPTNRQQRVPQGQKFEIIS